MILFLLCRFVGDVLFVWFLCFSSLFLDYHSLIYQSTKCESNCAVDCEEDWCCKDENFEGLIVNYG
jgi:hypothetical protein